MPSRAPLLWPAACLIAGVAAQHAFAWHMPWAPVLVGAVAVTLLLRKRPMAQSIAIGLCFLTIGLWRLQCAEQSADEGQSSGQTTLFSPLTSQFSEWRESLLQHYRDAAETDDQYAVLAAMTLGDKSALTRELRQTYAVAGASHILALSGLHLGIVYMLLSMLTLGRRRRWASQVVAVLGIWAFALLTGLATSVVRSATMISLYAVFSLGGRRRASVNILAFTAIVMLLADPQTLFDVGFQLSFLSVLSILMFVPLIDEWRPLAVQRCTVLRWLWGLTAVSVAAQLGVAPLVAYYFGQFPTYFLLTNIIVIPAATLILYGALLALVVPAAGKALAWVVQGLNSALAWLSQLPGASIDGLHPSVLQTVLCYAMVLIFYALLQKMSTRS